MSDNSKKSFIQTLKMEDDAFDCLNKDPVPDHCKSKQPKSIHTDSTNIYKFIKNVEDPLNYFASIYEVKKAEFKLECCCTM